MCGILIRQALCPVSEAPASVDWEQEINLNYNN